jgi:hypothetical protein
MASTSQSHKDTATEKLAAAKSQAEFDRVWNEMKGY